MHRFAKCNFMVFNIQITHLLILMCDSRLAILRIFPLQILKVLAPGSLITLVYPISPKTKNPTPQAMWDSICSNMMLFLARNGFFSYETCFSKDLKSILLFSFINHYDWTCTTHATFSIDASSPKLFNCVF